MTLAHLRELDNSEDWFDRDTWAELAKADLLGVAPARGRSAASASASSSCA